jgi:hypothetical protein
VEEKTYEIWYRARNHHRHKTETLIGTWKQLIKKLAEMRLHGKLILAIGEGGVFKPYKPSRYSSIMRPRS